MLFYEIFYVSTFIVKIILFQSQFIVLSSYKKDYKKTRLKSHAIVKKYCCNNTFNLIPSMK
jgi:hypothetical protein